MKTIIDEVKMYVHKFNQMRVDDFLQNKERFKLVMLVTMLDDPAKKEVRKWLFDLHETEFVDSDGQPLSVDLLTELVSLSRKARFAAINGAKGLQKQTLVSLGVGYCFSPVELWALCLLCLILFESTEDKVVLEALEAGNYDLDELQSFLLRNYNKPSYHFKSPSEEYLDNKHRLSNQKEDLDTRQR